MSTPRTVHGFDYRVQRAREQPMREWRAELEKCETAGGYSKRIGGDLTAFDSHGVMVFEIYDKDDGGLQ